MKRFHSVNYGHMNGNHNQINDMKYDDRDDQFNLNQQNLNDFGQTEGGYNKFI